MRIRPTCYCFSADQVYIKKFRDTRAYIRPHRPPAKPHTHNRGYSNLNSIQIINLEDSNRAEESAELISRVRGAQIINLEESEKLGSTEPTSEAV